MFRIKDLNLHVPLVLVARPIFFLFDKHNKLVYKGAIDDNAKNAKSVEEPFLSNAIDAMLAGEAIAISSTKALGCSIKFK